MRSLPTQPLVRTSWRFRRSRRGQPFRHGFAFTFSGGAYILVSLMVGLAAGNQGLNLLFLVFGILLGGLLVSGIVSTLTLGGLAAVRKLPPAAAAGQTVMLLYHVINRKRLLASYSLHVREHRPPHDCGEAYFPVIRAAGSAEQPALLHCAHRGIYSFHALTGYTRFPFSLFVHFARFKCVDEIVVHPAIGRLTHRALALTMRTGSMGPQPQPRSGGHEEFYGLREYREGDNPRRIHWRQSAHAGTLVMREMSPLSPRRLIVIVSAALTGQELERRNSSKPTRPRDSRGIGDAETEKDDSLEHGLSLAATLIDDAARRDLEVGLLVLDGDCGGEPRWHPPVRGRRLWLSMMRTLAAITPAGGGELPPSPLAPEQLRHLARAQCLWITRGLSQARVSRQVSELAAWNIAVQPVQVELADLGRLIVLPPRRSCRKNHCSLTTGH